MNCAFCLDDDWSALTSTFHSIIPFLVPASCFVISSCLVDNGFRQGCNFSEWAFCKRLRTLRLLGAFRITWPSGGRGERESGHIMCNSIGDASGPPFATSGSRYCHTQDQSPQPCDRLSGWPLWSKAASSNNCILRGIAVCTYCTLYLSPTALEVVHTADLRTRWWGLYNAM